MGFYRKKRGGAKLEKRRVRKGLFLLLFIIVFTINLNEVNASTTKVMWGKTELKIGQLGKVTVLADTTLWKLESDNSLKKIRTLKKGEEYRVYNYKATHNGLYGVGGGTFIQQGNTIKYETPSKGKLKLLEELNAMKPTDKPIKIEPMKVATSPIDGNTHVFYVNGDAPAGQRLIAADKVTGENYIIPVDHTILDEGSMYNHIATKDYIFINHYENKKYSAYRLSLQPPYKVEKVLDNIQDFVVYDNKLYYFSFLDFNRETHMESMLVSDIDGNDTQLCAEFEQNILPVFRGQFNEQLILEYSYFDSSEVSLFHFNLNTREFYEIPDSRSNRYISSLFPVSKLVAYEERNVPNPTIQLFSTKGKIGEFKLNNERLSGVSQFNDLLYVYTLRNDYSHQFYSIQDNKATPMRNEKNDIVLLEENYYYYFDKATMRIKKSLIEQ